MSRMQRFDWGAFSGRKSCKAADRHRSRPPRLEPLEDRRVLATPVVNSALDGPVDLTDNVVTLRDALQAANNNVAVSPGGPAGSGADTIEFAAALSGCTINLTEGVLTSIETLTIDASSLAENVTIDAQHSSRVLQFPRTTGDLTLIGITLQNGNVAAPGGGIYFISAGTLSLTDSTVSGNQTTADDAHGGGIYATYGTLILTNSTVSGNQTGNRGKGGGIFTDSGTLTLTDSVVSSNQTTGYRAHGGGVYANSGAVTLTGSTLSGNSTAGPGSAASGGGIHSRGTLTVANSTFTGNYARIGGGGIKNINGTTTVTGSTFSGNTVGVGDGGGIEQDEGNLTVTNSTIVGNSAGGGGGGISSSGNGLNYITRISNSTISGNFTNGEGGGVRNQRGLTRIENSTITGNSAVEAGDGVSSIGSSDAQIEVLSSIISGNTDDDDDDDVHSYL